MMVHFPKDVRNGLCLSHQTIEGISTTQNHREYVVFLHRILPYSRSSYIMNTGKLFKKYTETIFNRILSKYGRIRCKKKTRILSHSDRIQLNTVSVYFLNIFPYSLYKNSMNTGEYGAKTPGIHGGFV